MVVQGKSMEGSDRLVMAQGAGFYFSSLYTALSIGLLSMGLFTSELASRVALPLLARPIARWQYLVGRGLLVVLPSLLVPFALSVCFAVTYLLFGKTFPSGLAPSVLLLTPSFVTLGILVAALGFSLPPVFAAMLGWAAYAVSLVASNDTVREAVMGGSSVGLRIFRTAAIVLLPPFGPLQHLAHAILQDESVSWTAWLAIPWQLGYLVILMALAITHARRKDL